MAYELNDENPFRSPTVLDVVLDRATDRTNQLLLRQFRSQMHALGALWIICGLFSAAIAGGLIYMTDFGSNASGEMAGFWIVLCGICSVFAIGWISVGILTALKKLPAVYVGLVFSYISLIYFAFNFSWCPLIIFIAAVIQGHRVIKWGKQLQKLGVPLYTIPSF